MYKKLNFIDYRQESLIKELEMFSTPTKVIRPVDQSTLKSTDTQTNDVSIKKPPLAPVQIKQVARSDQF